MRWVLKKEKKKKTVLSVIWKSVIHTHKQVCVQESNRGSRALTLPAGMRGRGGRVS